MSIGDESPQKSKSDGPVAVTPGLTGGRPRRLADLPIEQVQQPQGRPVLPRAYLSVARHAVTVVGDTIKDSIAKDEPLIARGPALQLLAVLLDLATESVERMEAEQKAVIE